MAIRRTCVVNLRVEPYDVYIGRGSPWGNPFRIGPDGTRAEVIEKFRRYLKIMPDLVKRAKRQLRGKRLGCFCKPKPCHGDIWVAVLKLV